jgi:hypothetical protein
MHVKKTLVVNLADNLDYPNAIFILVDYTSPDDLLEYVSDIDDRRLHVYSYHHDGAFRMAHAKNMAARLGISHGADIIVGLDADNYCGKGFARYIATLFDLYGAQTFLWARMVQRCNEECEGGLCLLPRGHEVRHSSSQEILEWLYADNERPHVRGVSGRLVFSREAFLKTGGYNEQLYDTWGPDDRDLNLRLQRLDYVPREINGRFLEAVPHSERIRFKEFPHVKTLTDSAWQALESTAGGNKCTAVVNFGRVGTGAVTDRQGGVVDVMPYATRIWGCGFHKTSTMSLCEALKILGYNAAHWTTPRWARNIWEELREHGKSLTAEKHEAITDFPIGFMYQQIDIGYPRSKFVLTVRDESVWLESVRRHFSDDNQWKSSWDNDAFTHRMHTEIYGRKRFDADIFLARYRRHNAEVRAYFKDRPGDLLVMDMDHGAGWPELCAFLGKPIPDIPYPYVNGGGHGNVHRN